jgi:hypothetical protein
MNLEDRSFIVKNYQGEYLGEITFLPKEKKFEFKKFLPEEEKIVSSLLDKYLKEGIKNLGEVILEKPITLSHPRFLSALRYDLIKKGYILLEKNKHAI